MSDTIPPALIPFEDVYEAPPAAPRARRRAAPKKVKADSEPRASRRAKRTGAGAAWNPDNIIIFWVEVGILVAAVVAAGIGSVDGLLHYADRIVENPDLRWTLPVAVDVFLIGTALATLSLRRRRAYGAVVFCALVTGVLVLFSAACNYMYLAATATPTDDLADAAAPWVKAAMPFLLLAAVEIVAALTSTRNNREASPLNRAKADVKKYKSENSKLRAEIRKSARAGELA